MLSAGLGKAIVRITHLIKKRGGGIEKKLKKESRIFCSKIINSLDTVFSWQIVWQSKICPKT